MRDAGNARQRDQPPQSDASVELTKHLHAFDERAVCHSPVDSIHQLLPRDSDFVLVEAGVGDVGEADAPATIESLEHADLPHAERAITVVEHLESLHERGLRVAGGGFNPMFEE